MFRNTSPSGNVIDFFYFSIVNIVIYVELFVILYVLQVTLKIYTQYNVVYNDLGSNFPGIQISRISRITGGPILEYLHEVLSFQKFKNGPSETFSPAKIFSYTTLI